MWLSSDGQFYVNSATGLDTNPDSPTAPFKTVVKAIGAAAAGNTISVRQGSYGTDKPRLTKFLHLRNGLITGAARIGKPCVDAVEGKTSLLPLRRSWTFAPLFQPRPHTCPVDEHRGRRARASPVIVIGPL